MKVVCIRCGKDAADETAVTVDVVSGDIHCSDCDETYTSDDVQEVIDGWCRLLPWIRAKPDMGGEEKPTLAEEVEERR